MDVTEFLKLYWPLLIPLVIIQVGLMIAAILDLLNRPTTRGPKAMWVPIIVLVNIIGPVLYFVVGREEN